MGHPARLRKVGGSVMVAIPPALLEELDLAPDAAVGLSVKAGRLIVDPKERRRYTLDELLSQTRRSSRRGGKDKAWLSGPRAGRELL